MKIKICPADAAFSQYIRLRDGCCCRCGSGIQLNDKGLPISHQASHYFGRGRENTRFDPENVDCLCGACHRLWGSDDREAYREFKVRQLGGTGFENLRLRSNMTLKKDRWAALLIARQLLKELKRSV